MHQPRPYGRFAHEADLSGEDTAAVEKLARGLTNFKSVSQLDNLKRVATLSDGRQAVAIDMGGTFRILVLERHEIPEQLPDGLAETNVPMLFSGVITRSTLREGEGTGVKLTEQTRRRLAGYEDNKLPPKEVALQRFRIEYDARFRYFEPRQQGIFKATQYARQRPTWYSGTMSEVMQIVGGFGRQRLGELPDDAIERARMLLPERYLRRIRLELNSSRLPGYTGFPDEEGQFKYDYKHSGGNAVSFDSSGAPWLLQISSRGVFAMPLPVAPATTTEAFREYVQDVGDTELERILERFGGIPTGEPMPQDGAVFEAWRRAGVIIKVCETADFYDHNAYYAAGGWSLNSRGTEGFNTCWSTDRAGLKRGYAYKMKLQLGAAPARGMVSLDWEFADQHETDKVNTYLSSIYRALGSDTARAAAIKYKLRRHTVAQILARAEGARGASDVDYWDRLEMEPIASHAGSVVRVGEGPIYWGLKMYPQSQGRLKFPALSGDGCESFVMVSPDYDGGMVRCDTIVFGCYVDDELQVIKYFIDEREFYQEEESTFEDYMIVGQWEKTTTTGVSGLMGYFYTSAFDDRDAAPPVSTRTEIVGTDMGYGNPAYQTPGVLFCVGSLSRARYYQHRTKISTTQGFGLDAAVCVPVFARDCILYAYTESTSSRMESEETTRGSVADPTSYQLWCYDSIFHYLGQTNNGNLGEPRSKEGTPVYVDTLIYSPTPVSDFADSGNWFGLPPGGFLDVTGVCGPYTSRASGNHQAGGVVIGGEAPSFEPYSNRTTYPGESSGRLSISYSVAGNTIIHRDQPHSWYFSFSPIDDFYFYRDAVHVTFGESRYASINEEDPQGRRRRWGHTGLADHKSAHHFIGVINE